VPALTHSQSARKPRPVEGKREGKLRKERALPEPVPSAPSALADAERRREKVEGELQGERGKKRALPEPAPSAPSALSEILRWGNRKRKES